ncbi:MAG TPA: polyhydroxyalkanoic acid system family protein [Steroidobacteraceae bacterium]|nr:polyhydroxyalkanoic acid system family protein [Steroidobacteraceae bacterium]
MTDIALVRRHSLSIQKAKAHVQQAADALAAEHDLTREWHGDTLHFQRKGVHGQIHVSDSHIRLEVTLGLLLKPFKTTLLHHIERDLDRYLPEPKPAASARKTARKATHTPR